MATSLQPGVRESSDFDSRLAAFRPEEKECLVLSGAIIVGTGARLLSQRFNGLLFTAHWFSVGTVEILPAIESFNKATSPTFYIAPFRAILDGLTK
jgi:hypothetical protein